MESGSTETRGLWKDEFVLNIFFPHLSLCRFFYYKIIQFCQDVFPECSRTFFFYHPGLFVLLIVIPSQISCTLHNREAAVDCPFGYILCASSYRYLVYGGVYCCLAYFSGDHWLMDCVGLSVCLTKVILWNVHNCTFLSGGAVLIQNLNGTHEEDRVIMYHHLLYNLWTQCFLLIFLLAFSPCCVLCDAPLFDDSL